MAFIISNAKILILLIVCNISHQQVLLLDQEGKEIDYIFMSFNKVSNTVFTFKTST